MELTSHIDLTLVLLYVFWIFFGSLVFYLHRESKREGYPLVPDAAASRGRPTPVTNPTGPKTFRQRNGVDVTLYGGRPDPRPIAAAPAANFPGAPLNPTGNPLAECVGPAAFAQRQDVPDTTVDGRPRILPLRSAPAFHLEARDPDPRGYVVLGADRGVAGTVTDVWIDQAEYIVRYYEVALETGRSVLLPATMARIDGYRRCVKVKAIGAAQFAGVPVTKSPEQVTLLEEDMITGYFGGGYLYATPSRTEALL